MTPSPVQSNELKGETGPVIVAIDRQTRVRIKDIGGQPPSLTGCLHQASRSAAVGRPTVVTVVCLLCLQYTHFSDLIALVTPNRVRPYF